MLLFVELLDRQASTFTAADHAAVEEMVVRLIHDFEDTAPLAHAFLVDAFFPHTPMLVN